MKFWISLLFIFSSLSISAQEFMSDAEKRKGKRFFEGKTEIGSPFSLRDPFKQPFFKKKKSGNVKRGILRDGVFTNIPSLDRVDLSKIEIKGVFVGKNRRALAKVDGQKTTFLLTEGMKLGNEEAVVKAILPGGIVIVEKITNVYGQEEYLETIIPISD